MSNSKTVKGLKNGALVLVGFEDLIKKIEDAQGNVEDAVFKAARAGAREMASALKEEAISSNVNKDITDEISFQAERDAGGNRVGVRVGWRMQDNVDYNNLSAGQKAALLNYGTPSRHTRSGARRGWIDARNFIRRAKKKARPKIKKAEVDCLIEIVKELKK